MALLISTKYFRYLIPLMIFVSACAQTPAAIPTPTLEAAATTTPIPPEPQVIILENRVSVEQITLMDPDPDTGQIEVVVKGSVSNTCTSVDGVSLTRSGEIFSVNVETDTIPSADCQQKAVQFEETVMLDAQDMPPGDYLVTSGTVQAFEVVASQPVDEQGTSGETGDEGTASQETASTDTAQPTSDEPRECQDNAVFVSDITYPDYTSVTAGEVFTKTWEIRNAGTCTWGTGYELEFVQGAFDQVASLEDPFPMVSPQETVDISVVVTAPVTIGTHTGTWVIKRPEGDTIQTQNGQAFDFWAIVVVSSTGTEGTSTENREVDADGVVCALANSNYVDQLLQLINGSRADNWLPAYELQEQLSSAAKELTTDMACNDFVEHIGTDGSDWFDRITALGYDYEDAAENIAFGYGTVPQLALNWWKDSETHWGNILSDAYTQIGIAYALNPQTGGSYYTLVFARPAE